ncbi:cell division protein ZapA [Candidatus Wolbachia massiliensis]|uniref:Cell division protein ZapA n=1 Tax=Candidatus Wolbachia massiliensis TaxID=1845000 RepID=A0A7L7YPG7_9RICK|nr:cell division protein ZapA [Candidatus Wolbachia massiliensis]QOD37945.1 cell division protein ZapA [Candidatus Wolbachia massiliensis]
MQIVEIVIRNSTYKVSCENGKKDHLLHLANSFDKLVSSISQKIGGKGSDTLNFLLAALTLEDKVLELTKQLNEITQERKKYRNEKRAEYTEVLGKVNKIIEYIKD